METKTKSLFERCRGIDCSDILKKNYQGIAYIPWADAWARLKENFPEAVYEENLFMEAGNPNLVPYLKTDFGVWVKVTVTIEEHSVSESLPVMDNKMEAVTTPNARDINDNLKRCLVKTMALHGFGLQAYEKEDIYHSEKTKPVLKLQTDSSSKSATVPTGEFRFKFGQYKDKTFDEVANEVGIQKLGDYIQYLQRPNQAKSAEENKKSLDMNQPLFRAYNAWHAAHTALSAAEEPPRPTNEDYGIPF